LKILQYAALLLGEMIDFKIIIIELGSASLFLIAFLAKNNK
jgi:hypothetical protein